MITNEINSTIQKYCLCLYVFQDGVMSTEMNRQIFALLLTPIHYPLGLLYRTHRSAFTSSNETINLFFL